MNKKKTAGSSSKAAKSQMTDFEKSMAAKNQFLVTTMNMSWQLAIVVLLPILGGHYLDQKLGNGHLFLIIGFILAVGGMALVVRRQLKLIEPVIESSKKGIKNA